MEACFYYTYSLPGQRRLDLPYRNVPKSAIPMTFAWFQVWWEDFTVSGSIPRSYRISSVGWSDCRSKLTIYTWYICLRFSTVKEWKSEVSPECLHCMYINHDDRMKIIPNIYVWRAIEHSKKFGNHSTRLNCTIWRCLNSLYGQLK